MSCSMKIAQLGEKELEIIRTTEESLNGNICLLAVEKVERLYVLEAKVAPHVWERVDRVYAEIEGLRAYYCTEDDAKLAKASLKSLLQGRWKNRVAKYPIRIRHLT